MSADISYGVPRLLDPDLFGALSHPTRCVVIELLAEHAARPTDLGKKLENVFGLWHHLSKLVTMQLVRTRRVTRKRSVYSVNSQVLRQMSQQLLSLAEQAEAGIDEGDVSEVQHELEVAFDA